MRTINQAGIELIQRYEQCVLTAYRNDPAEPWTIGWGNTFYADGQPVRQGDTLTQPQADTLFLTILTRDFVRAVDAAVTSSLNTNQFSALCSLSYNIGTGAFRRSTLLKLVNTNPDNPAIRTEFMRWNKAFGRVLQGLTNRRRAEATLYFSPEISTESHG